MRTRRAAAAVAPALAAAVLLTATLTGCSPIVALTPATHANDPACADVIVRLPQTLEGLARRETNAQATGAWGDPAQVLLRCGVTEPTASDLPCVQVYNTDWLRDDTNAPSYVFTSYGRTPAIAVVIDQRKLTPGLVLGDLDSVVAFTKPNGRACSSIEDSLGSTATPGPTPTPTPTR
ncbi:DUF3515 family protein [Lysinimonas soli]|uniref:DUF3515 family protein n=1 Tax=Lysinimonas soli TaxID=1074233 RepID=A0ABW0NTX4_9MICO